ncbi:MAG: cytidylate kinase-like family protein [Bacteroidaceae bacterium]|nr:cytidylate kinase-like family protein [Bacteroidaceae bacterium]
MIITISRQLGSGGRSASRLIAGHYGINVYDKKLIELAAEQSGLHRQFFEQADESRKFSFRSFLFGSRAATGHGIGENSANNPLSGDALFKVQSDVIRDIAQREPSCIILGRCADYILRDVPSHVSIFITADLDDRVRRYAAHDGISDAEALTLIEKGDARRASYYNYYTQRKWGEAANYDLCINSSRLGIEGTAEQIIRFVDEFRLSGK